MSHIQPTYRQPIICTRVMLNLVSETHSSGTYCMRNGARRKEPVSSCAAALPSIVMVTAPGSEQRPKKPAQGWLAPDSYQPDSPDS